jgi:hypothetical protein
MAIYYQRFAILGQANQTVWDTGISSSEAEKIRVRAIIASVSDYAGNIIRITLEREEIAQFTDYHFDTSAVFSGSYAVKSTSKIARIPVDVDVPIGHVLRVGLSCGPTANNIYGVYEYEIVK